MTTTPTRTIDSRGRLTLGKEFADQLVIVRTVAEGVWQIVLAEAVPAKEAWLHKNKEALESVKRGLDQTASGNFADSPDVEGDARLGEEREG